MSESETLDAIKDTIVDLENSLGTVADNVRESIELAKSSILKIERIELWEYFSEVESESEMDRLQALLDSIKEEISNIVDNLSV